jgi:uncharacterized protein (DUF58 family)
MFLARPVVRPSLAIAGGVIGIVAISGVAGIAIVVAVLLSGLVLNYLFACRAVNTVGLNVVLPPVGVVGEQMNWSVRVAGGAGEPLFVGADAQQRVAVYEGQAATLPVVLDRRGVYGVARLRAVSAGPLSLPLHAARFVNIDLAIPICVTPARIANQLLLDLLMRELVGEDGEGDRRGRSLGEPHHLRAYQPGDPARLVHWPASARSGALVIREPERMGATNSICIVIDHLDGSKRGERMLSEAAWLCDRLVEHHVIVHLVTFAESQRSERVTSTRRIDWLLAEADVWRGTQHNELPGMAHLRVVDGCWELDGNVLAPAGVLS